MENETENKMDLVYITAPTKMEARELAHALVDAKLAACVNIFGEVESLYTWQGEVKTGKEFVLFVKTGKGLSEPIIEFVKKRHSYDCPSVIVLQATGGNREFFEWVTKITKDHEAI